MRIYLSSSFGNGKTTLKNWIAKNYSLKGIPEVARTVLAEREITDLSVLRFNTELVYEIQEEILKRQLELEKKVGDNFVCCRGLDSVAFLVNFADEGDVFNFFQSKLYTDYVDWLCRDNVYTFLVKPEKSLLKDDGLRDLDWDLSMQIYGSVKTILRKEGVPYSLIADTNMSERISNIKRVIERI